MSFLLSRILRLSKPSDDFGHNTSKLLTFSVPKAGREVRLELAEI